MAKYKRWQFFVIRFIAESKKHIASVGADTREDAIDLIMAMYDNVRALRVSRRGNR